MSDTYDLACRDCGTSIWIGQSKNSDPPFCFYSGEPETMKSLRLFLWRHLGHNLVMNESQTLEYEGITGVRE